MLHFWRLCVRKKISFAHTSPTKNYRHNIHRKKNASIKPGVVWSVRSYSITSQLCTWRPTKQTWRNHTQLQYFDSVHRRLVQVLAARIAQLASSDGDIVHPNSLSYKDEIPHHVVCDKHFVDERKFNTDGIFSHYVNDNLTTTGNDAKSSLYPDKHSDFKSQFRDIEIDFICADRLSYSDEIPSRKCCSEHLEQTSDALFSSSDNSSAVVELVPDRTKHLDFKSSSLEVDRLENVKYGSQRQESIDVTYNQNENSNSPTFHGIVSKQNEADSEINHRTKLRTATQEKIRNLIKDQNERSAVNPKLTKEHLKNVKKKKKSQTKLTDSNFLGTNTDHSTELEPIPAQACNSIERLNSTICNDPGYVLQEKNKKKKNKKNSNAEKCVAKDKKHSADQQRKFFNQDFRSYVEACVFIRELGLAQSKIKFYRYLRKKEQQYASIYVFSDTAVYDVLLRGWAKVGKLEPMKELISFMKEDQLHPSLHTYSALLECFGRQKSLDPAQIQTVINDMENDGYSLENIINESTFVQDERLCVQKALNIAYPNYSLAKTVENEPYSGQLVEDLNTPLPMEQVIEKNPYAGVLSVEEIKERFKKQLAWECDDHISVDSVEKKTTNARTLDMRKRLKKLKEQLGVSLLDAFNKKLSRAGVKRKENGLSTYPYFKLFNPQEYVDIMLLEIHMIAISSAYFSPSTNYLARRLGQRVYNRYLIQDKIRNGLTDQISQVYMKFAEDFDNKDFPYNNHRECWQHHYSQVEDGPTLGTASKKWSSFIIKSIGKQLYDLMMYDVKIDVNTMRNSAEKKMVPVLFLIYRSYGHVTVEELKPHPVLGKLYNAADLDTLTFETGDLPMLVPPVPWSCPNEGGHLLNSAKLIRLPPQVEDHYEVVEKTKPHQYYPVLDSLNTLGACPWTINKHMLDIIIDVFNNKGNKDLDIPPPVSECPLPPKITRKMTKQEKSKLFREKLKLKQQKAEMYSLWCNELYKLSIANKFRDEVFFFPHNMDFRGRTYPCPPHFNHLGSDVTRSLLLFAKGKPLGEHGLNWLKIHLVNLTGFKKRSSNVDRLKYANHLMPMILDSADNPMTGKKWWQKSDEPWQTLSCCMEIAQAIRSPDPAKYVCRYPVHQDGSCNGLQHYAAIGRDQTGAESVNLYPYDSPKDVYSDVAELVEHVRAQDASNGVEIAKIVEGFVRRKVIKQTVMTTVYGVTRYGAKYQILRQLRDIPDFPKDHVWAASTYLTDKTFECLQQMFTATKEIQDWLTVSAHTISNICQRPVEWTTPLGLPVLQPYHKMGRTQQRFGVSITGAFSTLEKPNAMKQKNGFPPNFIHSLDSTHMMLTALYCFRAGITFVSVHDCYWTHPCNVDIMNKVCREQFVSLHSQPILEDLSSYLVKTFASNSGHQTEREKQEQNFLMNILTKVPNRGEFDLQNVLKSTYFFS